LQPVGHDGKKRPYWLLCGSRLFRSARSSSLFEEENGELLAWDTASWTLLLQKDINGASKSNRQLHLILSKCYEGKVKPLLDILRIIKDEKMKSEQAAFRKILFENERSSRLRTRVPKPFIEDNTSPRIRKRVTNSVLSREDRATQRDAKKQSLDQEHLQLALQESIAQELPKSPLKLLLKLDPLGKPISSELLE